MNIKNFNSWKFLMAKVHYWHIAGAEPILYGQAYEKHFP